MLSEIFWVISHDYYKNVCEGNITQLNPSERIATECSAEWSSPVEWKSIFQDNIVKWKYDLFLSIYV